jgi:hypothetical protein
MTENEYAFIQRDQLILVMAGIWKSHKYNDTKHKHWPIIVCIHTPSGNIQYHIHEKRVYLFDKIPFEPNDWDGSDWNIRSIRLSTLYDYVGNGAPIGSGI